MISMYSKYPLYIIKCGKLPIIASRFAASNSYSMPGDTSYYVSALNDEYFCTEAEAQSTNYRRAPW